MDNNRTKKAEAETPPVGSTCELDYVRNQIRQIEGGMAKVLLGDYSPLTLEDSDPMWGNLATQINVLIKTAREATERAKTSDAEAAEARDWAILAAASESRFLANVTHELRTPLASIRASAEIARDFNDSDPEVYEEFLSVMISESDHLTRLIENVLDLGELESGKSKWTPGELHVEKVVHEVVRSLRPLAVSTGIDLCFEVIGSLPVIVADCDRLTQLWGNIISNALKFSPLGESTIRVTAHHDAEADEIVVEVRDQGAGIPPEELASIFDRFRQAGCDVLTEKPSGTGLGLAIAKEIVQHHGGRITAESELGQGSMFRTVLPVVTRVEDWGVRGQTAER